jgi:hypothetical protein
MNISWPKFVRGTRAPLVLVAMIGAAGVAGCGPGEPRTDAERLARGREILDRMSAKLGSAQSFSVSTREVRDVVKASGPVQVSLSRETIVRRPNRLYFKTTGGLENEGWYDGVGLTLAIHKEKVFAQARMPETLDRTLDAFHERYGISTPLADFLYSSPSKALLTDKTTGGWVGRETVEGQLTDHLSFKDTGVNYELWIAASGDPLPVRTTAELTDDKRLKKVTATYSNWNLAAQTADNRFTPAVPADYEGIAMIQRARVMRNMPEDQPEPTATTSAAAPGPAKK